MTDKLTNQNGGNQAQTNAPSNTDSVSDYGRNPKQESHRNKELHFLKSDKRRRAENWISPCSV
jgi:hypothetical protein